MFKKIPLFFAIMLIILGIGLALPAGQTIEAKNDNNRNEVKTESKFKVKVKSFFNWSDGDKDEVEIESESESESESDDDYDYREDERLPSGLRHAPGIEKRVEDGKGLPFGWWFKLFGNGDDDDDDDDNGTTTPSTLAISNITESVGTSTATIGWHTNFSTRSVLNYSTSSPATTGDELMENNTIVFNHQFSLSNLEPETTYYYLITATTSSQTATTTGSFTTSALPTPDTEAPDIIFSVVTGVDEDSARFIWVTTEASDSRVWVSTSTPETTNTPAASNNTNSYYHDLTVTGLSASTTYQYLIGSADETDNLATTSGSVTTD